MGSLTPYSRETFQTIVTLRSDGYKDQEIATLLGSSREYVERRLERLRNEIELENEGFFPMSDEDYEALHLSISEVGVKEPVVIGEHMLIDGRNRCRIAAAVGIGEVPARWVFGLSEAEERELMLVLNVPRRHLTQAQKQDLVRFELHRNPERSDRMVAALCGSTHPTVAAIRAKLRQELLDSEEDVSDAEIVETEELKAAIDEKATAKAKRPLENLSTSTAGVEEVRYSRDGRRNVVQVRTDFKDDTPPETSATKAGEIRFDRAGVSEPLSQPLHCPHCNTLLTLHLNRGAGYTLKEHTYD